ncbi:hypothetical protein HYU89_00005 [Candidatus Collierbacteria bacterium]|nr:hypothetical protein [Candidatus Collierbacteria bacterium]
MRYIIFFVLVLIALIFLLRFTGLGENRPTFRSIFRRSEIPGRTIPLPRNRTRPTPINSSPSSTNPFGVMLGNSSKVSIAKDLNAVYYRPTSIFIESWNDSCLECDAALSSGLKLILTVRNNGGNQQPTTPPSDLSAYKKTLSQILDKYRPEVLVVENEENSQALFYTGSSKEYHGQLKAACEVAHSKGIKCANGGLVSSLVAILVADSYKRQGQNEKGEEYLKRTLRQDLYQQYIKDPNSPRLTDQITRGRGLLSGYKAAGADYINFHWYIADSPALEEAVNFLENYTDLPAMSNEVGQQQNTDPNQVTKIMQKIVDLQLPFAVWFSIDISIFGEAKGLTNPDGSLRANGEAFRDFISAKFQ